MGGIEPLRRRRDPRSDPRCGLRQAPPRKNLSARSDLPGSGRVLFRRHRGHRSRITSTHQHRPHRTRTPDDTVPLPSLGRGIRRTAGPRRRTADSGGDRRVSLPRKGQSGTAVHHPGSAASTPCAAPHLPHADIAVRIRTVVHGTHSLRQRTAARSGGTGARRSSSRLPTGRTILGVAGSTSGIAGQCDRRRNSRLPPRIRSRRHSARTGRFRRLGHSDSAESRDSAVPGAALSACRGTRIT